MTSNLLWLDLETTGLNPEHDLILEIGLVVTRGLEEIAASTSIVIDHGAVHMPPEVLDLHLENGLLQDIGKRGVTPHEAYTKTLHFLNAWWPSFEDGEIIVGGSGIDRFDIPFLRAAGEPLSYIPSYFYYGTHDTSGLKRILKTAGITLEARGGATHRAVADAEDSFRLAQALVKRAARPVELRGEVTP